MLSEQNILDCTPNPLACGGHGGCTGATPVRGTAVSPLGHAPLCCEDEVVRVQFGIFSHSLRIR